MPFLSTELLILCNGCFLSKLHMQNTDIYLQLDWEQNLKIGQFDCWYFWWSF